MADTYGDRCGNGHRCSFYILDGWSHQETLDARIQHPNVIRVRRRDALGQAAACWAQMHGITMLMIDGLLSDETVGPDPVASALSTFLEGLAR